MAIKHRTKETAENARRKMGASSAFSSIHFSEQTAKAHRLPGSGWYIMSNVTRMFK